MDRISDLETVLAAARKRIEGLEAALRLCIAWMPLAEVHSWPPGFRLRKEALAAATAALSSPAVTAEGKKPGEEGVLPHEKLQAALDAATQRDAAATDTDRLNWLDLHCAFVADGEYCIGPYRVGELRKMADDGIATDRQRAAPPKTPEGA